MDFSEALNALKAGDKVTSKDWNNKSGMYLQLQSPDENSKNTEPYIMFFVPCKGEKDGNKKMPYWPSNRDLFSEDWIRV